MPVASLGHNEMTKRDIIIWRGHRCRSKYAWLMCKMLSDMQHRNHTTLDSSKSGVSLIVYYARHTVLSVNRKIFYDALPALGTIRHSPGPVARRDGRSCAWGRRPPCSAIRNGRLPSGERTALVSSACVATPCGQRTRPVRSFDPGPKLAKHLTIYDYFGYHPIQKFNSPYCFLDYFKSLLPMAAYLVILLKSQADLTALYPITVCFKWCIVIETAAKFRSTYWIRFLWNLGLARSLKNARLHHCKYYCWGCPVADFVYKEPTCLLRI